MADINAIAKQFTDFYYQTFDSNRSGLAPLYRDHSMLSFEGQPTSGATAIVEKLVGLPFQTVQHRITTMDAQPASQTEASMIVLVTGQLITGDEANALSFSQTFHLKPADGSYYVYNDVFRLVYG
ncbi:nuclear transport factor 2 [Microbotryum lychnidis-dioicae p1A1 Lamole]|uniref:Nuclear transport factor 2 n=1 Tax=Microbotryum lychnidis-dioicae (strain p1A1 Lamole / MvSl-1064) TaxID=683840 RepID=U5H5Y0_USTV1|nr:nuclear transport factor 2 [Microbotryum lychnidis-dioicae p1A1 Lamole]|eukprot:KDE06949.1 nuclear transport factor 2 [Microbotryum lychnidis-dioicae p1A1 Lamole]